MKGPKKFYEAVSVVSAPQVSSVYVFAALSLASGIATTGFQLLVAVLFASLTPTATLYAQMRRSKIDSNVQERGDRPALFLTAILSYLAGFVSLRYLGAPFIFDALMLAYFVNTILAAFITKYVTKVSIHTWGVTGPSIAILYSCGLAGFVPMLVAGSIVAGSRVALGYHTVEQVSLSVLVSIPFTWFVIYILPTILPTLF
jgi:inosine-uridine nucleoside N-ribohydrolase